jgi:hypothetical protein
MGTKITEMTTAGELDGDELVPITQGGANRSVAAEQLGGGPAGVVDDSGSTDYSRGVTSTGKDSTGVYTITLATARDLGTWVPVVALSGTAAGCIAWSITSTTTFKVRTFDAAAVATDYGFSFAVVVIG